ncbi:hypothetical protein [Caldalkalibacillus mannanilyticus]|uniref:hypothetical protein n=1 Tax=Caldalkalibacillus mannanilyticus TaxID=1418 RepID=UPI00131F24E8|nr:hypothetical protein [Caldalkalibacillus mannanilyticus]
MRTGGQMSVINNVITLSTGHFGVGTKEWNGYQQEETMDQGKAGEIYQQRSGKKPAKEIVHPEIYRLQEEWTRTKGNIQTGPGWLGETLDQQGIYTAAFGNSDVFEQRQRLAATFVMNFAGEANGLIDKESLRKDLQFPTGWVTDWEKIIVALQEIWSTYPRSFTVIELGDLERIEAEKEFLSPLQLERTKKRWLEEVSAFFSSIAEQGQQQYQEEGLAIWLLSPMVSKESLRQGKHLAPLVTWQKGQKHEVLLSATTKQKGIVANVDLIASILEFYSIEQPSELVGKGIVPSKEAENQISTASTEWLHYTDGQLNLKPWQSHLDYLFTIYQERRWIITIYVSLVILLLVATTVYWWFFRDQKAVQHIQILVGTILLSPLFFLWITPLILYLHAWLWIVVLLLSSMLLSICLKKLMDNSLFLALIGLVNSIVIVYDLLQGSLWMKRSFLGYDPMIGARYYGLGNEYAGILLGSSLLGVTGVYVWLMQKKKTEIGEPQKVGRSFIVAVSLMFLILLYFMAAPQYGTNAGATLASLLTFLCSIFLFLRVKCSWKHLLSFSILLFAIIGFIGYLHLQSEHTHIGSVVRLLVSGEWEPIRQIVYRKLEMNLKLIRVSLWGKLFVTSFIVLLLFLFWYRKHRQDIVRNDPWLHGFQSIVVGAVLILLVNDSGIVAAATTMMYVTFPYIFLRFKD